MITSGLKLTCVALIWIGLFAAVAFAGQLAVTADPNDAARPARQKIAITSFALPKALDGVTSTSLVDLMLKAAKDSPRYEAVVPNDHLAVLLEKSRLDLASGKVPSGRGKDKLNASFLLVPSVSRAGKTTTITASVVDLSESRVVNTFSVEAVGETDRVFSLVEQLWGEVDSPCTGSYRVMADGQVWDLLSSRAVVYDGRHSMLERAQKIKPAVKKAEVVFHLIGSELLKSELRFEPGNEELWHWHHDAATQEHFLGFQMDDPEIKDIDSLISKYMFTQTNVKRSGTFYLLVHDRYGGSKRFDLMKATWEHISKPGVSSSSIRVEYIKY